MQVTVKLFAMLKEGLGESVVLDVPEPATVRALLQRFSQVHPRFAPAVASLRVAVDHAYAQGDEVIRPGQEVAIIPPVSGG